MLNKVYIAICFLVPWLYGFILHLNYYVQYKFTGYNLVLWQTLFHSLLSMTTIVLMLISYERIVNKKKNLLCFIAAMQIPFCYIAITVFLRLNTMVCPFPRVLSNFFYNGQFSMPVFVTIIVLYFLKWKDII